MRILKRLDRLRGLLRELKYTYEAEILRYPSSYTRGLRGRIFKVCVWIYAYATIRRRQEHLVDALALRGEEGRGTLRKAMGRRERSLIHGNPNGATRRASVTLN